MACEPALGKDGLHFMRIADHGVIAPEHTES